MAGEAKGPDRALGGLSVRPVTVKAAGGGRFLSGAQFTDVGFGCESPEATCRGSGGLAVPLPLAFCCDPLDEIRMMPPPRR